MREISSEQRRHRMRADNPWWETGQIQDDYSSLKPRAYIEGFTRLVRQTTVRRAVVLMGPRRVGKTVLIHHVIARLLDSGKYASHEVGYLSLDRPLYMRLSIEKLSDEIHQANQNPSGLKILFLDEIQYLPDWERHLKAFVDTHPHIKCIVSGSSAAALRLKSIESGAGRFTDFLLPPLTFYEYLDLQQIENLVIQDQNDQASVHDIEEFNHHFIDYINFGGYPETLASPEIRSDATRYVGVDIIEKVLLRDLPSLYGIQDVQELYALFTTLAYNTAGEVSLDDLSQDSGVAKPTIKRYLEYLEAAFLIKVVHRIDQNARRFKRITRFKVYVTAPALRCALFGPIREDDPEMGLAAETAAFAQWFHSRLDLHYAGWKSGEVDIVHLDRRQQPDWCVDIKWSDRYARRPEELKSMKTLSNRHPGMTPLITTRTVAKKDVSWPGKTRLDLIPTSTYCYMVGRRAIFDPDADTSLIVMN